MLSGLWDALVEEAADDVSGVPVVVACQASDGARIVEVLKAAHRFFGLGRIARVPPDTVVAKGMWEAARMRTQPMILR